MNVKLRGPGMEISADHQNISMQKNQSNDPGKRDEQRKHEDARDPHSKDSQKGAEHIMDKRHQMSTGHQPSADHQMSKENQKDVSHQMDKDQQKGKQQQQKKSSEGLSKEDLPDASNESIGAMGSGQRQDSN